MYELFRLESLMINWLTGMMNEAKNYDYQTIKRQNDVKPIIMGIPVCIVLSF